MDKDAWELCKNLGTVNELDWQKAAGYVEYGFISRVMSADTVVVTRSVQDSVTPKVYTVRLLGFGSSIVEDVVEPQVNDQVLLLFLHAHNDDAFLSPEDTDGETIKDRYCKNYTMFTGLGILMRTFKGRSSITRSYGADADGATMDERVNARVRKLFNRAFSIAFDSIEETSGAQYEDSPVNVYFGPKSPLSAEVHAATDILIGMDSVDDTVEFPAPITVTIGSSSPVSVSSKSSLNLAFDGKMSLGGSSIELNGNSGFVTEFNALKTGLNALVTAINQALASKENGSGTPGSLVLSIDSAKVATVKV